MFGKNSKSHNGSLEDDISGNKLFWHFREYSSYLRALSVQQFIVEDNQFILTPISSKGCKEPVRENFMLANTTFGAAASQTEDNKLKYSEISYKLLYRQLQESSEKRV